MHALEAGPSKRSAIISLRHAAANVLRKASLSAANSTAYEEYSGSNLMAKSVAMANVSLPTTLYCLRPATTTSSKFSDKSVLKYPFDSEAPLRVHAPLYVGSVKRGATERPPKSAMYSRSVRGDILMRARSLSIVSSVDPSIVGFRYWEPIPSVASVLAPQKTSLCRRASRQRLCLLRR